MTDKLSELIKEAISLIPDDEDNDFALSNSPSEDLWYAEAVNHCWAIHICETGGEFVGVGETPEDAVIDLIANLQSEKRSK